MNNSSFEGIDCIWLASDIKGHVASFITAGYGYIPEKISKILSELSVNIEAYIYQEPCVTEASLLVSVPRPDSYIDLAKRGFFVYDWNDIHRVEKERVYAYEKTAFPVSPVTVGRLDNKLSFIAKTVSLNIDFRDKNILKFN